MNDRERFLATMRYQPRDRAPICDFGFWVETAVLWHDQGLPAQYDEVTASTYFGMDSYADDLPINTCLQPWFEYKVIEDRGDFEVVQGSDGVRVLHQKFMGSIPTHEAHVLVDRESWLKEYKPRLDPSSPERFGSNWPERLKVSQDPNKTVPTCMPGGSLYGWIRNWMGMENVSYAVYDDPAWFGEMVETVADCIVGTMEKAFAEGVQCDCCGMWEDMCYSGGPLLGVEHFKQYLVPQYRRITDLLHRNGVEIIWLDCDGKIDDLMPLWLDAGVNCMFPVEIGTWGADPIRYRNEYGKDLLMMGGFDKHILAQSKDAITAEVERLAPLVEEGGFIPFCDHRVPPDVSYENYLHYLRTARRVWGKDLDNLKPMCVESK